MNYHHFILFVLQLFAIIGIITIQADNVENTHIQKIELFDQNEIHKSKLVVNTGVKSIRFIARSLIGTSSVVDDPEKLTVTYNRNGVNYTLVSSYTLSTNYTTFSIPEESGENIQWIRLGIENVKGIEENRRVFIHQNGFYLNGNLFVPSPFTNVTTDGLYYETSESQSANIQNGYITFSDTLMLTYTADYIAPYAEVKPGNEVSEADCTDTSKNVVCLRMKGNIGYSKSGIDQEKISITVYYSDATSSIIYNYYGLTTTYAWLPVLLDSSKTFSYISIGVINDLDETIDDVDVELNVYLDIFNIKYKGLSLGIDDTSLTISPTQTTTITNLAKKGLLSEIAKYEFNLTDATTISTGIKSIRFLARCTVGSSSSVGDRETMTVTYKRGTNVYTLANTVLSRTYASFTIPESAQSIEWIRMSIANVPGTGSVLTRRVYIQQNGFYLNGNLFVPSPFTNVTTDGLYYETSESQSANIQNGYITFSDTLMLTYTADYIAPYTEVKPGAEVSEADCTDTSKNVVCLRMKGNVGDSKSGIDQEKISITVYYSDETSSIIYNYYGLTTTYAWLPVLLDSSKTFSYISIGVINDFGESSDGIYVNGVYTFLKVYLDATLIMYKGQVIRSNGFNLTDPLSPSWTVTSIANVNLYSETSFKLTLSSPSQIDTGIRSVRFQVRAKIGDLSSAPETISVYYKRNSTLQTIVENMTLSRSFTEFSITEVEGQSIEWIKLITYNSGSRVVSGVTEARQIIINDNGFFINDEVFIRYALSYMKSEDLVSTYTYSTSIATNNTFYFNFETTFPLVSSITQPDEIDVNTCTIYHVNLLCMKMRGQQGELNEGFHQERVSITVNYEDGTSDLIYDQFPLPYVSDYVPIPFSDSKVFKNISFAFLNGYYYTNSSNTIIDTNVYVNLNSIYYKGRMYDRADIGQGSTTTEKILIGTYISSGTYYIVPLNTETYTEEASVEVDCASTSLKLVCFKAKGKSGSEVMSVFYTYEGSIDIISIASEITLATTDTLFGIEVFDERTVLSLIFTFTDGFSAEYSATDSLNTNQIIFNKASLSYNGSPLFSHMQFSGSIFEDAVENKQWMAIDIIKGLFTIEGEYIISELTTGAVSSDSCTDDSLRFICFETASLISDGANEPVVIRVYYDALDPSDSTSLGEQLAISIYELYDDAELIGFEVPAGHEVSTLRIEYWSEENDTLDDYAFILDTTSFTKYGSKVENVGPSISSSSRVDSSADRLTDLIDFGIVSENANVTISLVLATVSSVSPVTSVSFELRGQLGSLYTVSDSIAAELVNIYYKFEGGVEQTLHSAYALTTSYSEISVAENSGKKLEYIRISFLNSYEFTVGDDNVKRSVIMNNNNFVINGDTEIVDAIEYLGSTVANSVTNPEYLTTIQAGRFEWNGDYFIRFDDEFPRTSAVVVPGNDVTDADCDDSSLNIICFLLRGANGLADGESNQERVDIVVHYETGSTETKYSDFGLAATDTLIKLKLDISRRFQKIVISYNLDQSYNISDTLTIDRALITDMSSFKFSGVSTDSSQVLVSYQGATPLDSSELISLAEGEWTWPGEYTITAGACVVLKNTVVNERAVRNLCVRLACSTAVASLQTMRISYTLTDLTTVIIDDEFSISEEDAFIGFKLDDDQVESIHSILIEKTGVSNCPVVNLAHEVSIVNNEQYSGGSPCFNFVPIESQLTIDVN